MSTNPAEAEASGVTTVTVEWRDLPPFEVPIYRIDWPFDAALAWEQQNDASAVAALLPPVSLVAFRAMNPTGRDGLDLLNEIARAIGAASSGESPASSS